jgi:hypothetical protein
VLNSYRTNDSVLQYESIEKGQKLMKEMGLNLENLLNVKVNISVGIFPQNNNFFETLSIHYVSKIWYLWELVILETPIIISADTPTECSDIVLLLSSLIFPLKCVGDIRPYFTMEDNDFREYKDNANIKNTNSPILGIINPICFKLFKDWPMIHFDELFYTENGLSNPLKNPKTSGDLCINNYKKKFLMSPNQTLIKTLAEDYDICSRNNTPFDKINMYLRLYLIELNNDFMRTFEEYFFTHEIEYLRRISFIKKTFSVFEIFKKEKFLLFLNIDNYFNLRYMKDKKKTVELYSRFIETKIFSGYLNSLL